MSFPGCWLEERLRSLHAVLYSSLCVFTLLSLIWKFIISESHFWVVPGPAEIQHTFWAPALRHTEVWCCFWIHSCQSHIATYVHCSAQTNNVSQKESATQIICSWINKSCPYLEGGAFSGISKILYRSPKEGKRSLTDKNVTKIVKIERLKDRNNYLLIWSSTSWKTRKQAMSFMLKLRFPFYRRPQSGEEGDCHTVTLFYYSSGKPTLRQYLVPFFSYVGSWKTLIIFPEMPFFFFFFLETVFSRDGSTST